ncbi:gibberellin 2-beta-dioxygenase-like [Olea europaea var. sylvestris]|uniref:gibberellin 2-beta-dioxygenase-like n=1 Tax=Olea europaea var. sylvestris TaxID=158386 RepID=UPI000C1D0765|nr:gibberellin 2-beta-dioxygenase-like [Olea europaea var. sylvestris]
MVVLSQPVVENFAHIKTCKPTSNIFTEIPVVSLLDPDAKTLIVEACKEFGFFKVINHGVPTEFIAQLEDETVKFFNLPLPEKEKSGLPNHFGYGNKKIGQNGDVGWVEYLLFSTNPELFSPKGKFILPGISESFWSFVNEYVSAMRNMACEVLEMIAEELKIEPRDILSKLLRDEKSDNCFRLNHYPPCSELQALSGRNLIGFGDHTDPQIISIIRSNNTSGLQIALKDGTWVSVPPDHSSFFINVGDSLQVLTNGRFRSVRHRVLAGSLNSRISMIFFGGPPLTEKITPLSSIMEQGEESLYNEFTWYDYKKAAYKTRLSDNKLGFFEKSFAHN